MHSNFNSRKAIAYAVYGFLVIFLAYSLLSFSGSTEEVKQDSIMGYRPIVVVTGSMAPTIGVNSLSIVEYCSIDTIEIGDIIMYQDTVGGGNRLITHRVVSATVVDGETVLKVQGDNNELPDGISINGHNFHGKIIRTYNEIIPFMNLVMPEPGVTNPFAIANGVIILTVGIVLVYLIISKLFSILQSMLWAQYSSKKFDALMVDYEKIVEYQKVLSQELKQDAVDMQGLTGGDKFQYGRAKSKIMRELAYFKDNNVDVVRAKKRYDKLIHKIRKPAELQEHSDSIN